MTITLTREEAQQVLDALDEYYITTDEGKQLVETLRARLSAPEPEQTRSEKMREAGITRRPKGWSKEDEPEPAKLLLIPALMEQAGWVRKREWQGLTDEERTYLAWESKNGPHCVAMTEAKLKEKNT